MLISVSYSENHAAWWFSVNDAEGGPLIVSPAMFKTHGDAQAAGSSELARLETLYRKWELEGRVS